MPIVPSNYSTHEEYEIYVDALIHIQTMIYIRVSQGSMQSFEGHYALAMS